MVEPAWSFSSLSAFEQCPLRYKLTRVTKLIKEPPTEATTWGNRVHKALEERVRDGTPLPATIAGYEPLAAKLANSRGEVLVEQKVSVNAKLQPTEYFAKDVWCRGVLDVAVIGDRSALILDWKTGKRKDDLDQLKLFAGMAFAYYPALEKVDTGFVWLKDNKVDRQAFTRKQVGDIWATFLPRVKRLNLAFENDRWPANPSGLCRNYCPVGKTNCDFCGQ